MFAPYCSRIIASFASSGRDPEYWAWATLTVAALYNGVALAARDWLIGFLKDRVPSNLGAPLASLPRMQEALGEIEGLLTVNARLLSSGSRDVDAAKNARTREPVLARDGLLQRKGKERAKKRKGEKCPRSLRQQDWLPAAS